MHQTTTRAADPGRSNDFGDESARAPAGTPVAVYVIAAVLVAAHLLTAGRYGIFRDELYYIACARHPATGYVDHPPLIAWVCWLVLHTLGSSLLALRLLPALAAGALVLMTARVTAEWGGGRFAQGLAALAVAGVPVYLILQHWLTMNAFEPLLWTGLFWAASRLVLRHEPRWWLLIGVLVGIGLETKYSIGLPVAGLFIGLLLTPERKWLWSPCVALAALVAILLFLPNLLWLVRHDFPFMEFERHSRQSGARILRGPVAFLLDQMRIMNPVLAPVWLAGFAWFIRGRGRARALRPIGLAALLVIAGLLLLRAKNYYAAPVYPVLFAAGAVDLERRFARRVAWRVAYPTLVVVASGALAPLVMPILPPPAFLAYHAAWHGFTPVVFEREPEQPLPQYFADEFGWEEMARATALVYHRLPPAARGDTAIFANNYGEAAAIDYFGPRYGLPPAIGKAQSYWLWGPRRYDGRRVIVLGSDGRGDREVFRVVAPAARVLSPYARADERFTIFLCQDIDPPLPVLWPRLKTY